MFKGEKKMRETLIAWWLLAALVSLIGCTKAELSDDLLLQPFKEIFGEVQNQFQNHELLLSKYGRFFNLAQEMCRSGRREMTDYCNLEHLILQFHIQQTNLRALRRHEDRRFLGAHGNVIVEQYLEALDDSAELKTLVSDLKVGLNMTLETTADTAKSMGHTFAKKAQMDIAIAETETAYVDKQLGILDTTEDIYFGKHPDSLSNKLAKILSCTVAGLSLFMSDEIMTLSFDMSHMSNLLAQLFKGFDINPYFERAKELFNSVINYHLIRRFENQMDIVSDKLSDINARFNSDSDHLSDVMKLFESEDFSFRQALEHMDKIGKLYEDYSPIITRHDFTDVLQIVATMMDETCYIVDELAASSNELVIAAIATVKDAAQEYCLSITADLAVLDSFYKQIYEFQFAFMDSLIAIMKGKVAVAKTDDFVSDFDTEYIDLGTTSIGLAMDEVLVQAVAHTYCSIIEYERGGVRPPVCRQLSFTPKQKKSIKELERSECIGQLEPAVAKRHIDIKKFLEGVAYSEHSAPRDQAIEKHGPAKEEYKFKTEGCTRTGHAYLPTAHEGTPGKQYIDMKQLLKGEPQYVTIPSNVTWLRKYGWLSAEEPAVYQKTYLVHRLQVYVPGLTCEDPLDSLGAEMEFTNTVSMRLHVEDSEHDGSGAPGYTMKPLKHIFKWDERLNSCNLEQTFRQRKRGETEVEEVDVCVRTGGTAPVYDNDLYPSLFTTWEITMKNTICKLTIPDVENYAYDVSVFYEMIRSPHNYETGGPVECWPDPCHAGVCIEGENTYACECPEDTSGKNCETGVHKSESCDRTYNTAAFKPTGMYTAPQTNRMFSYFAVDGDISTCAESKETYTPWFYVELPWHAVLCEIKIFGELPTEERNQVKVAVSRNKPSENMFTHLEDAIHAEDPRPTTNNVYTVTFPTYQMADLYRYLVIYEPDSSLKSQLKICDIQAYSNNGAFNKLCESAFNEMECDWATNILSSSIGNATQSGTLFNDADMAIDDDVSTCSEAEGNNSMPWWMFTFEEGINQVCGVRIVLPSHGLNVEKTGLWVGFYYGEELLEPGEDLDEEYFRPCGEEIAVDSRMIDIFTANCDVIPMKGEQLIIYSTNINVTLSLCDVQVFGMAEVVMVP